MLYYVFKGDTCRG